MSVKFLLPLETQFISPEQIENLNMCLVRENCCPLINKVHKSLFYYLHNPRLVEFILTVIYIWGYRGWKKELSMPWLLMALTVLGIIN